MTKMRKRTVTLIAALVFTIAGTVVAFAADILYLPQYSSTTGRYTQVYEMSTSYNWRYTTNISDFYGYDAVVDGEDGYLEYGVKKMYSNRDGLVQCTSNGLTVFPTYYQIYTAFSSAYSLSPEAAITGTGTTTMDLSVMDYSPYRLCLGIRHDPRYTSSVTNKGNWSPDTY